MYYHLLQRLKQIHRFDVNSCQFIKKKIFPYLKKKGKKEKSKKT